MENYFSIDRLKNVTPQILPYLGVTLQLVAVCLVVSTVLAVVLAVLRIRKIPVLHQILGVYISYMRGTPLLTQMFVVYYGLPLLLDSLFGMNINRWDPIYFAEVAIIMNEVAFLGETFRAALLSVSVIQSEAAFSIGMTRTQTFFRIVLPQFIRIILPIYGTTIVGIFQGTSAVYMLGVIDIMGRGRSIANATGHGFEAYLVVALIYIVISLLVRAVFHQLEHRMSFGRGGTEYV